MKKAFCTTHLPYESNSSIAICDSMQFQIQLIYNTTLPSQLSIAAIFVPAERM